MGSPSNGNEVDVDAELLGAVLQSKSDFIPNMFWSPYDVHVLDHVKETLLALDIDINQAEMCACLEIMQEAFSALMVNSEIHILI
jgi:hypothetical protein